ncbi:MAG TPA: hypothetical protein VGA20_00350 [Gemmatimonadales bacterium]
MIAKRLGVTLVPAVLLLNACTRESARAEVPENVAGTYTFVGADTTRSVPWAARIELVLAEDSTFQFELRIRVKDEDEQDTKSGTYRIAGDRLVLVGPDQQKQEFELEIRGDSLVLDAGWVAMAALRVIGVPRPVLVRESPR